MKILFTSILFLSAIAGASAQEGKFEDPIFNQPVLKEKLPDGEEIMDQVRSRLPRKKITLEAVVEVRRKGKKDRYLAATELDFAGVHPHAEYVMLDFLGGVRERLQIAYPAGAPPLYLYFKGDATEPQKDFSPAQSILDVPITWSDLSLAYLWWPGAKCVKSEQAKLRKTWVIDIPSPHPDADACDHMRLWVDTKELFVMKGEARDADGKVLRAIEADSLHKVSDDIWMVENIDIDNEVENARVLVKVKDIRVE